MPESRYPLPGFLLATGIDQQRYVRWLKGRALAHAKRDNGRGHSASAARYRLLIHEAVCRSEGRDFYTGEALRWDLIGTYSNVESKAGRHGYKARFSLMPSVDHENAASTFVDAFRICGWATNDSKHDLTTEAFVDLCRKIVLQAERRKLGGGVLPTG